MFPVVVLNLLSFLSKKFGQPGFLLLMCLKMPQRSWCRVEGGYKSPFGFLVSTMYLERCLLRTSGSVESSTSSGIGSVGLELFLVSLHCSKFFRAQLSLLY